MSSIVSGAVRMSRVERHALEFFPEECCGGLLGRRSESAAPGQSRVTDILPATNVDPGPRTQGYTIAPESLLLAHQQARRLGQEVLGYYHSHPRDPARPSPSDRRSAGPGASYLIVAIDGERVVERRSWRLRSDRTRFDEETVRSD